MSYIIIHTNNREISRQLNIFENGDLHRRHPPHKEYFIEAYDLNLLGNGIGDTRKGTIKVMKNCGMSWIYISSLVEKDPMGINIFIAEDVTPVYIPELFKKAGKWLIDKKGRKLKDVPHFLGMSEDMINDHFIDGEKKLRKKGKID